MVSTAAQRGMSRYQQLLDRYQALSQMIGALLQKHSGGPELMSMDELAQYRALAQERDEIVNEMRLLEQELFDDAE